MSETTELLTTDHELDLGSVGGLNEAIDLENSGPAVYLEPLPSNRRSEVADRLVAYDPSSGEAEHLRAHQVEAVSRFYDGVRAVTDGKVPNQGMAVLHPTGSGKTVTSAEIVRMLCKSNPQKTTSTPRALILVPGHQILHQTTGDEDELGAIRTFVPDVSVAEYSGKRKNREATVTVMTYQALPWAMARGDIDHIDPTLVVCDEAHHIIDGTWASAVESVSQRRLLLGLTATPAFSATRNIRRLFPNVLVRKTMKEGIAEGILSEMQGFIYKGSTRISISKYGADYDETELFDAVSNGEDNYLAAKICAQEVAVGRKGVVSCVPGFDKHTPK